MTSYLEGAESHPGLGGEHARCTNLDARIRKNYERRETKGARQGQSVRGNGRRRRA